MSGNGRCVEAHLMNSNQCEGELRSLKVEDGTKSSKQKGNTKIGFRQEAKVSHVIWIVRDFTILIIHIPIDSVIQLIQLKIMLSNLCQIL